MAGEDDTHGDAPAGGTAALEHLTGPSRGTVSWLGASAHDISLEPDGGIRVTQTRPGHEPEPLIARLRRVAGGYDVEVHADRKVWINGQPITHHELHDCDMIEFEDAGPLSRFHLYSDSRAGRKTVADILSDAVAYLQASRQPAGRRVFRALGSSIRRLTLETTILFRVSVVVALCFLAVLAYQQIRVNALLEQRIERSSAELRSFASALARARREALTPADLEALREEIGSTVVTNAERLAALEKRASATAEVIARSAAAVAFLQGAYGFRDNATGRMLRHLVDAEGRPMMMPGGQPFLTLEGDGPVAERQFTGTAFAVGDGDTLITNRHLALPWEYDSGLETLTGQGLEPTMIKLIAYLPGQPAAIQIEVLRASDVADVAVLKRTGSPTPIPVLALADSLPAQGEEVIVMGYPTGLRSLLLQAGEAFIEKLQETKDTDFWNVAARLAEAGLIAPLASRGIVGQATPSTIVYDAETTHGGSGGPVLGIDGRVVAVNAAILPEYGGSNLGAPAAHIRALLDEAEATD